MKLLRSLVLLCALASAAGAAWIEFPLQSFFHGNQYTRGITVRAVYPMFVEGTNIYAGSTINVVPTGGTNPIVRLSPNTYTVTFADASGSLQFAVTNDAIRTNVLSLLISTPTYVFTNYLGQVSYRFLAGPGITLQTNNAGTVYESITITGAEYSVTNLDLGVAQLTNSPNHLTNWALVETNSVASTNWVLAAVLPAWEVKKLTAGSGILVSSNAGGEFVITSTGSNAVVTGDGSGITNLNASNLSSGTVSTSRLPASVALDSEIPVITAGANVSIQTSGVTNTISVAVTNFGVAQLTNSPNYLTQWVALNPTTYTNGLGSSYAAGDGITLSNSTIIATPYSNANAVANAYIARAGVTDPDCRNQVQALVSKAAQLGILSNLLDFALYRGGYNLGTGSNALSLCSTGVVSGSYQWLPGGLWLNGATNGAATQTYLSTRLPAGEAATFIFWYAPPSYQYQVSGGVNMLWEFAPFGISTWPYPYWRGYQDTPAQINARMYDGTYASTTLTAPQPSGLGRIYCMASARSGNAIESYVDNGRARTVGAATASAWTAQHFTDLWLGATRQDARFNWNGVVIGWMYFGSMLNTNQVAALDGALQHVGLIVDGDSKTTQDWTAARMPTWDWFIGTNLATWGWVNVLTNCAVGGTFVAEANHSGDSVEYRWSNVVANLPFPNGSNYARTYYAQWGGYNDLGTLGVDGYQHRTNAWTATTNLWGQARAKGYQILAGTIDRSTNSFGKYATNLAWFNGMVKAHPELYDALADIEAGAQILGPYYYTNQTYWVTDQVHQLGVANQTIHGPLFGSALAMRGLVRGTVPASSSTAQLAAGANVSVVTNGSLYTVSLPDALDLGTVTNNSLYVVGEITSSGQIRAGGGIVVTAGKFIGDGSGLTNVVLATNALTADNIAAGSTLNAADGSALTNLSANKLASGYVPPARLGSGTANSTVFLRGDNSWQAVGEGGQATNVPILLAGTNVSIAVDGLSNTISVAMGTAGLSNATAFALASEFSAATNQMVRYDVTGATLSSASVTLWPGGKSNALAFTFDDPEYLTLGNENLHVGYHATNWAIPFTWMVVGATLNDALTNTIDASIRSALNTTGENLSNLLRQDFLSGYAEIGGHGFTHTNLATAWGLDPNTVYWELTNSLVVLSNTVRGFGNETSNHVVVMASPSGGVDNAFTNWQSQYWLATRGTTTTTNLWNAYEALWQKMRILEWNFGATNRSDATAIAQITNQFRYLESLSNCFVPVMFHNLGSTNNDLVVTPNTLTNIFASAKALTNTVLWTYGNLARYARMRSDATNAIVQTGPTSSRMDIGLATLSTNTYGVPLTWRVVPNGTSPTNWTASQLGVPLACTHDATAFYFAAPVQNGPVTLVATNPVAVGGQIVISTVNGIRESTYAESALAGIGTVPATATVSNRLSVGSRDSGLRSGSIWATNLSLGYKLQNPATNSAISIYSPFLPFNAGTVQIGVPDSSVISGYGAVWFVDTTNWTTANAGLYGTGDRTSINVPGSGIGRIAVNGTRVGEWGASYLASWQTLATSNSANIVASGAFVGSGTGLTNVPLTAIQTNSGSQGKVLTWHGGSVIWSNPPAGSGTTDLSGYIAYTSNRVIVSNLYVGGDLSDISPTNVGLSITAPCFKVPAATNWLGMFQIGSATDWIGSYYPAAWFSASGTTAGITNAALYGGANLTVLNVPSGGTGRLNVNAVRRFQWTDSEVGVYTPLTVYSNAVFQGTITGNGSGLTNLVSASNATNFWGLLSQTNFPWVVATNGQVVATNLLATGGTNGQVLTATATGIAWSNAAAGPGGSWYGVPTNGVQVGSLWVGTNANGTGSYFVPGWHSLLWDDFRLSTIRTPSSVSSLFGGGKHLANICPLVGAYPWQSNGWWRAYTFPTNTMCFTSLVVPDSPAYWCGDLLEGSAAFVLDQDTNQTVCIGFSDSGNSLNPQSQKSAAASIGYQADWSPNWIFCTAANASRSFTTSSVPVLTNTFYRVEFSGNSNGISCWLNGSLIATHTPDTHYFPTNQSLGMILTLKALNATGAAATNVFWMDYYNATLR